VGGWGCHIFGVGETLGESNRYGKIRAAATTQRARGGASVATLIMSSQVKIPVLRNLGGLSA